MLLIKDIPVHVENPSAFFIEITATGAIIRQKLDISGTLSDGGGGGPQPDPDPQPEPLPDFPKEPTARERACSPPADCPPAETPKPTFAAEVVDMATSGVGPRDLCREFHITAVTLRKILSGYGSYRGQGGNEAVWSAYFTAHQKEIKGLIKGKITEVALA